MDILNKRVKSLVKRNKIEIGYIGHVISSTEPFAVIFNVDGTDYIEKLCLDEIEVLNEVELDDEGLYDVVHFNNEDIKNGRTILVKPLNNTYVINLDDIKNAVSLCLNDEISLECFAAWFYTIYFSLGAFKTLKENELVINDLLEAIDMFFRDEDKYFSDVAEEILKRINAQYSNASLPLKDRVLTDGEMIAVIKECISNKMSVLDDEYTEALFVFLEKLRDRYSKANFTLGYIYYYGIFGAKKDIDKALEEFHKAYDNHDYEAGCFLGKIYLDNKEYDTAYKYLTYAAFQGYYLAKIILADMFLDGLGVIENHEIVFNLIRDAVNEIKPSFEEGITNTLFADAIIKYANLFEGGIGVDKDLEVALVCYLEALYAVKIRIKNGPLPLDNRIKAKAISGVKRLNKLLGYCKCDTGNVSVEYIYFIRKIMALSDDIKVKVLKEGNYITLLFEGLGDNKCLITEPKCNYVELTNKISLSFGMAEFKYPVKKKMIIDEIDLISELGCISFYKNKKLINELTFQDVYFNRVKRKI